MQFVLQTLTHSTPPTKSVRRGGRQEERERECGRGKERRGRWVVGRMREGNKRGGKETEKVFPRYRARQRKREMKGRKERKREMKGERRGERREREL